MAQLCLHASGGMADAMFEGSDSMLVREELASLFGSFDSDPRIWKHQRTCHARSSLQSGEPLTSRRVQGDQSTHCGRVL